MENYTEILKNLYLGNAEAPKQENFFDLIINVADKLCHTYSNNNCKKYIHLPLEDENTETQNNLLLNNLDFLINEIHTALKINKKILVHCRVGVSRSASVVVAAIMKITNSSLIQSICYVKTLRPYIFMYGVHFEKALLEYERKLKNKITLT